MDYLHKKKFDFVSRALPADTFGVVRFKGVEGFSTCYQFEIDLVSKNAEIDLTTVLKNPVSFTILREDGDIPFHGILAQFEQLNEVDEYVFYRAILVPKLWWLSLTHHNQVFLNKTVPEIIEEVLKDGGLTSLDFEFKLQEDYPKWEYLCQYRESHLNFVSRWMEREGMYYYFEQTEGSEKVIITDTKVAHTDMPEGKTMYYSPVSGLDDLHREEVIKAFICRQKMLPGKLSLKDYNYMKPSMEITGSAEVSPDGRGEVYIYGEHFRTPKEGNALAKVRAEELLCQERRFHGDGTIPYLRPGYLFDLEDHYRNDYNQQYLTIEIEHEGSQTAYLIAGIQKGLSQVEEQPYYRNSFQTIPSDVQFRPPLKSQKPRFYGTLNAKIDAAGTGKYAELDDQGRYKVVLPFDQSGRKDGKASAYFRMAQPYAGTDHGMHFPLHKGTEVLLTFIDGDPDRPIINAAVPNPETPNQVTSADQTMSKITTAGGNKIHIEDQEGSERILMHTPNQDTWVRMGAPNDPPTSGLSDKQIADANKELLGKVAGLFFSTVGNIALWCVGDFNTKCENSTTFKMGFSEEATMGISNSQYLGLKTDVLVGGEIDLNCAYKKEFKPIHSAIAAVKKKIYGEKTKLSATETKLQGEITELKDAVTKLEGEVTNLRLEKTELNTEKTELNAGKTELNTEETKLNAEKTELNAEETKLNAGKTELNAEETKLNAEKTELNAEETKLNAGKTELNAEETKLSSESMELTGLKTII